MYYRYEIETEEGWKGIFSIADTYWRRYIARYISVPRWYEKQENPREIPSRCWFTQYGFDKYHHLIEDMIEDYKYSFPNANIRILKRETINNLVMKGKVQVIELLDKNEI